MLLLFANRNEKMASYWAGHCHFSFIFFFQWDIPEFNLNWYICSTYAQNDILHNKVQDYGQRWKPLGADGC